MGEDPSPTQRSPSVKALPLGHKSGASVLPVSSLLDRAAMRLPLSRACDLRIRYWLLQRRTCSSGCARMHGFVLKDCNL